MQRSELEEEIGRLLSDKNHERCSISDIRDRIELAQEAVQNLTSAVKTTESLTPTADTAEVTVDEGVMDITRVTFTDTDGEVYILEGRSREDLDFYNPGWENDDSDLPRQWSFDASNRQIILYPKPSSSHVSTNCLKAWEVRRPSALTADDSEPFDGNVLMRAYSMSIAYWVAAQFLLDESTPESFAKSQKFRSGSIKNPGEFEKEISKINAKFNHPSGIPERIKWYPEGGRRGGGRCPTKSYPI